MNYRITNLIDEVRHEIENDASENVNVAVGLSPLDLVINKVADHFLGHPENRAEIRTEISRLPDTWPLVVYVRHLFSLINNESDVAHVKRGLAVAAMVYGTFDYRDIIVSLTLLRAAAIKAKIEMDAYFEEAKSWSTEGFGSVIENVVRRPESSLESTVAMFGPPVV